MENRNSSLHTEKTGFLNVQKSQGRKNQPKRKKNKSKKDRFFGIGVTIALWVLLFLMIVGLWALFIAGPSRIRDEKLNSIYSSIEEQVPGIAGLQENAFDYITYQGYTEDTLYWFDVTGQVITTREMISLDYNKAKEQAKNEYGIDTDIISLAYGYTAPVYEIKGSGRLILLDYDTLERVYERSE